jgi:uncharacterized membrane protein YfcA
MALIPDGRTFVIILIAGVFGGVVRGYSGSGFALAAMPILTIVLSPVTTVPVYRSISLSLSRRRNDDRYRYGESGRS